MSNNLVELLRRPYGNLTFAEKQEAADLIEELEAKLAYAKEALEAIVVNDTWGLEHDVYMMCRAALRKLKEKDDE